MKPIVSDELGTLHQNGGQYVTSFVLNGFSVIY